MVAKDTTRLKVTMIATGGRGATTMLKMGSKTSLVVITEIIVTANAKALGALDVVAVAAVVAREAVEAVGGDVTGMMREKSERATRKRILESTSSFVVSVASFS